MSAIDLLVAANKKVEDVLAEIDDAFFDIPFENSGFQTKVFVVAAQKTPARAYRTIGLNLYRKIQAINELKHAIALEDVDIEEWRATINSWRASKFDKRRAQINIDKALGNRNYTEKLLNDAIDDLNMLYAEFKRLPKYTREQFEAEEQTHFETALSLGLEASKAGIGKGEAESLMVLQNLKTFEDKVEKAAKLLEEK